MNLQAFTQAGKDFTLLLKLATGSRNGHQSAQLDAGKFGALICQLSDFVECHAGFSRFIVRIDLQADVQ